MKRLTPASLAAITIGSKASRLIDVRQLLVELEAGVVGDAREVDHRVDGPSAPPQPGRIADVALDDLQVRIVLRAGNRRRNT